MTDLSGAKVVVTAADRYMGPAIAARFGAAGAEIVADTGALASAADVEALAQRAGPTDVLIANFAQPPLTAAVDTIEDGDWFALFDSLVHPLMRVVRHFAGAMKEAGSGKIIAITSAAPLRGIPHASGYCAARGAQNAFIRAVGLELAKFNVQVNAIAQNYIKNDTYYPEGFITTDKFKAHLQQMVPAKRVGEAGETAELALYLALPRTRHMVGQVIPLAGGWV
ncbi:SDR family oxidoreductase [Exilibacterium tricleocarpae]|uniref:SDR family oxidoreductase n=1 Tax=Exilibacterium tricleocarpae TaxID=2591008 RepID=A0A545TLR2_9GAMM|nr:SDR family oxidoreductase [Exilibacterium tricleocarpae]TQV78134.1 SDR family oxidoreductase [Exilibacterium tricleocarpae]